MSYLGQNNIVGNYSLHARLYSDIKSKKLSHAYIIEGKKGSGRHLIAMNIIAALACESDNGALPCLECRSCKSIFEGKCPDVYTISKEDKASVGIESVRQIKETVSSSANDLDFKAYIIDDTDTMTVPAQNAFLLTLEQPPVPSYFFLICENARALLETIRSRAPVIRTEPVETEDIDQYLCSDKPEKTVSAGARELSKSNPEEYQTVLIEAGGSIGRALELLNAKKRAPINSARQLATGLIESLRKSVQSELPISFYRAFSQKRDELIKQLDYVKTALRDLIVLKKSEDAPLCFFYDREQALEMSSSLSEKALFSAFEKVSRAQKHLSANSNVRLTLTELLAGLQK